MPIAPLLALLLPLAAQEPDRPTAQETTAQKPAAQEPAAQEPDRLLAAVPANAELVVSLASLDELRRRATTNAWWKMARDEDVWPLFEELGRTFETMLAEDMEEEDEALQRLLDPREWFAAVHGRAAGYLAMDGDRLAGGGLLVEPGAERAAFDELWSLLLAEVREEHSESSQEYQGVELSVFEQTSEPLECLIVCEVEGVQLVALGEQRAFVLELAQGGIDRLLGKDPAPGFAADPALAEARAAAGPAHVLECFVDVSAFVRFAQADDARAREADEPGAPSVETAKKQAEILGSLGLSAMRYAYLAGDFGEDERFELALAAHLPPESLLQRGLSLLGPAPRELLALAPADSVSVTLGAVDLPGLLRLVRTCVEQFVPENLEQFEAGLAAGEAALGLSIEKDLLELVPGRFASIALKVPEEEIPAQMRAALGEEASAFYNAVAAFVVAVEDGDEVSALATRLLGMAGVGGMIQAEDYQGFEISSLELGVQVQWACTDDYVVYSEAPTPLRAVLARIGGKDLPTLLTDERFKAVLEAYPRAAFLGLGDARVMTETYLGVFDFVLGMIAGMSEGEEEPPELERLKELLPPPEVVRKYIDGVVHQTLEVGPESLVMRVGGR
jgi:hypothetical protein